MTNIKWPSEQYSLSHCNEQHKTKKTGRPLPSHLFLNPNPYGSTVKVPELVAVPSGVVIPILPVFAPVGTVAVTFEVEFTVKLAALTPPNVTWDALVIPPPMMT